MTNAIKEAILLRLKCSTCGTKRPKEMPALSEWNQRFFICPNCWKTCCNTCFKTNIHGDGHTFFCPHCGQLLKFP